MTKQRQSAAIACLHVIFVSACTVGGRHTPDSKLEEKFILNEFEFESLVADVNSDKKLAMLSLRTIRYAGRTFSGQGDFSSLERLGLSNQRRTSYGQILQKLGISQLTKGENVFELVVDPPSLWNGDSYKGYAYSRVPPKGHYVNGLDKYRISEGDKDEYGNFCVYKPIKGNWYLFLVVNGG